MLGCNLRAETIDHMTPIQLAIEMRRSSVLGVFDSFIGSDERYADLLPEFNAMMGKE